MHNQNDNTLLSNDMDEKFKQVYNQLYNIQVSSKQNQNLSQLIEISENNNQSESLGNCNIEPIINELKQLDLDPKSQKLLTDILCRSKRRDVERGDELIDIRGEKETSIQSTELGKNADTATFKYNELCRLYETKYEQLGHLQQQFDQLLERSKLDIEHLNV